MKRCVKGLGLLLFSILLAVCFEAMEWRRFDLLMLEISWPAVFIVVGVAGLAPVFLPQPPEERRRKRPK